MQGICKTSVMKGNVTAQHRFTLSHKRTKKRERGGKSSKYNLTVSQSHDAH